MYGYIYETKNKKTGEYYVGQKKSSKFIKSYYGSGSKIRKSLKEYGKENFVVKIIEKANSQEELDNLEIKWIKIYKEKYKNKCLNINKGGLSGYPTHLYLDEKSREEFIQTMTYINKKRCKSEDFKEKTSKRMKEKYKDPKEREKQSKKIKKSWNNEKLRKEQSKRLKEYYKNHEHDCSFNNIKCGMTHGEITLLFENVKTLREHLKRVYDFVPSYKDLTELLESELPYKPFHYNKPKMQRLSGTVFFYVKN